MIPRCFNTLTRFIRLIARRLDCSVRGVSLTAHFVYVIQSEVESDRFYVGLTDDLARRLAVHNSGGSAHTVRHRPWRMVTCVEFSNPASARTFER
jgi:putative endonuclease